MAWQSFHLFQLDVSADFLLFVFFGTLCSYNFHWFLTPLAFGGNYRANWSIRHKWLHFLLYVVGLFGSVFYTWRLIEHWPWLLLTVFFTFLYSAPKVPLPGFSLLSKIAIGKTIFLAFAWAHITAFLPLLLYENSWTFAHEMFAVNRFFLIYAICIPFDYRDRDADRREGIRCLITFLNETGIDIVFWGSLLVFFGTSVLLFIWEWSPALVVTLTLPGIILAFLYQLSKRNFSDYLYYFVLDGLMMLSALLLLVFHFF